MVNKLLVRIFKPLRINDFRMWTNLKKKKFSRFTGGYIIAYVQGPRYAICSVCANFTISAFHDYEYLCPFGFAIILEFSMRASR